MSNFNSAEVYEQDDDLQSILTDFDNQDNQQKQRPPGAIERLEDHHSNGFTLQLSSASRRENMIACKSLNLFEGSEIQQNDQPRANGMLHDQTIDPTLKLASGVSRNASFLDSTQNKNQASAASSGVPLTDIDNFGRHDQASIMEQPGEKEKSEIDSRERRRLCQKRCREKQKQEALETKEKLEKATRENYDLERKLAEFEKIIETREKKIDELRRSNSKLQNDYEKLQENSKDRERKNEKLKGKYLKLKGKILKLKRENDILLRQIETGKIGNNNKLTTNWTKFPLENMTLKIKGISCYMKLIDDHDDDMNCE